MLENLKKLLKENKMLKDIEILEILTKIAKEYSGDRKTQVGSGFYLNSELKWGVNHLAYELPEEEIVNRTTLFYDTMIHAEASVVAQYGEYMKGATVYVTLFPCNDCADKLISVGVSKVIVLEDRPTASYIIKAKELFNAAGIEYTILG